MRQVSAILLALLMAACGGSKPAAEGADAAANDASTGGAQGAAAPDAKRRANLPEFFDCVRENGGMLIAAHRGGPQPGFPENSLETLKNSRAAGLVVFEIDIGETKDGMLFLMHDDRLGRTTNGNGYVSDTSWTDISALKLKDEAGTVTGFSPAKFTDVLLWAKQSGAILELDRKETTSFKNLAAAVKAAGAEDNVIYITYNDEQAAEVAKAVPGAMMTASAFGDRNIQALEARGVNPKNLIAWTGTREAYPDAWTRLIEEGVEPAFGTLGREGERLDDVFWMDGNGSEYQMLAEQGLVLLATDEPFRVAEAIKADDVAVEKCGT